MWTAGQISIAKALEPYNIMYLEDVMINTNADAYAELASRTSVPLNMSETLATRYEYRRFFERRACSVCMYDCLLVRWPCGSEEDRRYGRCLFHSDFATYVRRPLALYLCSACFDCCPKFFDYGEQLLEMGSPVPVLCE